MTIRILCSPEQKKAARAQKLKKELMQLALSAVALFLTTQSVAWHIWGDEPIFKSSAPHQYLKVGDEGQSICTKNIRYLCGEEDL